MNKISFKTKVFRANKQRTGMIFWGCLLVFPLFVVIMLNDQLSQWRVPIILLGLLYLYAALPYTKKSVTISSEGITFNKETYRWKKVMELQYSKLNEHRIIYYVPYEVINFKLDEEIFDFSIDFKDVQLYLSEIVSMIEKEHPHVQIDKVIKDKITVL